MRLGSGSKACTNPAQYALAFCIMVASGAALAQDAQPLPSEPANQSLQLPGWVTKAKWRLRAAPFQDAVAKGGAIVLQMRQALERQLALAQNAAPADIAVRAGAAQQVARAKEQMEQQIKQIIPQYRNQYLHILHGELQSLRTYCELPPELRAEVFKTAETAYDQSLEQFVRGMYMPADRGRHGGAMRSTVRASLVALLEKKLPPEEFTQVERALKDRADLRKRVCIHSVLARMDDAMRLTAQQREKIAASLQSNWTDDWEAWLMLWQYEENYLPQVEDSLIVTYLTPQQRRIWQQTQKISLRGEMHSEFAAEFDAAYWNVTPKKTSDEVDMVDRLGP